MRLIQLISFKFYHIQEEIQNILNKWGEDNTDDFILKAKKGIFENVEIDTISIRQLVADYKRLKDLLESIKSD